MAKFLRRSLTNEINDKYFDLIISGGGMVGTTLACAIGKLPWFKDKRILLIENSKMPELTKYDLNSYSNRVSAINPSSKKLFETLGLWKQISQYRYREVTNMKVWGQYSNASTSFSVRPGENIAYIVENDLIVLAATNEIQNMENVSVKYGMKVKDVKIPPKTNSILEEKPSIVLSDDTELECRLLAGADGANSLIRQKMGVKYLSWKYNQMGIVATLKVNCDGPNHTAWQKFLPTGPLALLPLTDNLSSLVWSTSIEEANKLSCLSDESFVDAINTALMSQSQSDALVQSFQNAVTSGLQFFKFKLKNFEVHPPYVESVEENSRAKFPLSFGHSSDYISRGVCLIGDAAHKVHPLAGQGVNLGFHDIQILSDVIATGCRDGRVLGNRHDLQKYESSSLCHNLPLMAGIDFFHRLYVTDISVLKAIGNASFLLVDHLVPLKTTMQSFASK